MNDIAIKYALIKAFMYNMNKGILDISYSKKGEEIEIQVVLVKGYIPEQIKEYVNKKLPNFDVTINHIYITKEQYNESINEWSPKYYNWLENVLFSKAEVL
jgi:hypothetical protein